MTDSLAPDQPAPSPSLGPDGIEELVHPLLMGIEQSNRSRVQVRAEIIANTLVHVSHHLLDAANKLRAEFLAEGADQGE